MKLSNSFNDLNNKKILENFVIDENFHLNLDAEFAFGIYDCDGSGKIDAYDIPDVLRSLNLNPTMDLCEKMGATKKRGEKKLTVEEFLPIFGQVRQDKTQNSRTYNF